MLGLLWELGLRLGVSLPSSLSLGIHLTRQLSLLRLRRLCLRTRELLLQDGSDLQ